MLSSRLAACQRSTFPWLNRSSVSEDEMAVMTLGVRFFVRQVSAGESILVDPVEVSEQAQAGSGEFIYGWWEIRTRLAEPARQWVELLEGRFPKARRR